MDRRLFLLLALAGCSTPSRGPGAVTRPDLPPHPPSPFPQVPPESPATAADFEAWLMGFRARAILAGMSPDVLDRELAGLTPNDTVVRRDKGQPEIAKPIGSYVDKAISADRISLGRGYMASLTFLPDLEARFRVPKQVILAVWAVESAFGRLQGDFDIIRAFATLAYDGRRAAWAESELMAALTIIATGEADRQRLTGSWAGAMGQTQFLPSVFLSTAVDGDGDGKRDVWTSTTDALASTANFLAKAGWRAGQGWSTEVVLPEGFDFGLAETMTLPVSSWTTQYQIQRADSSDWPATDLDVPAVVLLPAGANGPAFLALKNHFVIRAYNNSTAYALTVGLLADRFAGGGPLRRSWPPETPLSLEDRLMAQRALASAGFDPGPVDGVIGLGTRKALRAWQRARALPADAYLSADTLARLRSESAAPAVAAGPPPQ